MPVPSNITDLSTTAGSNSPAGTDSIGTTMDDYIRAQSAFIAQLRDGSKNLELATATAPALAFTGDSNTGIFSAGGDSIALAAGGTKVAEFSNGIPVQVLNSASSTAIYTEYKTNGTVKGYVGTDGNGILSTGSGDHFGVRSENDLLLMANSVDVWRIDSAGFLKNVANTQPGACVVSDGPHTYTTATEFTGYSTEVYDYGGNFASGRFTAPVAGRYLVNLRCRSYQANATQSIFDVRKNGNSTSGFPYIGTLAVVAGYADYAASAVVVLAASDYLSVFGACHASNAIIADHFEVNLLY